MTKYNWNRSYRIEFGTPEVTPANYYQSGSKTPQLITPLESQHLPSNALKIGNLASDGFSNRGFTFTFKSKRSLGSNSNEQEVTTLELYNINNEMKELLNKPNCIVQVSAGYGEDVTLLYKGYVKSVTRRSSATDIIYQIQCKDSLIDANKTRASINIPEKYNAKEALQTLSSLFPTVDNPLIYASFLEKKQQLGGYSFDGNVKNELNKFCRQYKLVYAIHNGKLVLMPKNMVQGDTDYSSLAKNNYTLNSDVLKSLDPVKSTKKNKTRNVVITTFLIPIYFNQFVTIPDSVDSKLTGTYRPKSITYNLQSRGTAWDVTIEGEPI